MRPAVAGFCVLVVAVCVAAASPVFADDAGHLPTGADGKALNLDFEAGSLADWTAEGAAFEGQPVKGDTVTARGRGMASKHQGEYWIGGYEISKSDEAVGTLTSKPFKVSHRWAAFRVAGGPWKETRVELVRADSKEVVFQASGTEHESLRPVVVDLSKHAGQEIFIRVVDQRKGAWGHVNFDDFRFYEQKPKFENVLDPKTPAAPSKNDEFAHAGLSAEEAVKAMTLPPGFKATVFAAEPEIINPIAFCIDHRGRLWVVQALTYPRRAPEGEGKDSILIFEDTDNDGRHDKRTVFAEGLNLVSGIEVGFGGVWVGAAPYLLFIPDKNGDDKPDGEPQILLDGWGYQDTHETLNSFIWGPDGWLYGCHGVFTDSNVGKPGTPQDKRVHINAGIWRYHPTRHVFERFAEGTSNPWGLDYDANGQFFIEACVIPHLWHIIQNARYQRQGGRHDNPYTFDDIKQIGDHVHYLGATPHGGNNKSDAAGGGHAHAGMMCYLGDNWPAEYRGKLFMNNIHGARINMDIPEPKGSGFVGRHGKDFMLFNDRASQVINMKYGPDGGVYIIDWYDLNQCHHNNTAGHDRTTGRIYKVTYGEVKGSPFDMSEQEDSALVSTVSGEWAARTGRRLLQERAASRPINEDLTRDIIDRLDRPLNEQGVIRLLLTLHVAGKLSPEVVIKVIAQHRKLPHAAGWAVQLLCEGGKLDSDIASQLAREGAKAGSPVFRRYLASALHRLPIRERWGILAGLLSHPEDADDHNLPLLYWYGLESVVHSDAAEALDYAQGTKIPNILAFTVRRLAAGGGDDAVAALAKSLGGIGEDARRLEVLRGINAALKGRRNVAMPAGWDATAETLLASKDAGVRAETKALSVTFGSKAAIAAMQRTLADSAAPLAERSAALESLLAVRDEALPATLRALLKEPPLRAAAIRGLASYDDAEAPAAILALYPTLAAAEKKDALLTLAARPAYAKPLLEAVGTTVPRTDITADVLRQLRTINNTELEALLAKNWGTVRDSDADKVQKMKDVRLLLAQRAKAEDLAAGRFVYNKACASCHVLFGEGGKVGPDITGSERASTDYLLLHVIDPNAVIPNDYQASIVDTKDNRTIVGIIKQQDDKAVTVLTANETLTLQRSDVASIRPSKLSMMPEGLLDPLAPQEIRDLVAYLKSPKQVPLKAEPAKEDTVGPGAGAKPEGAAKPEAPAIRRATAEDAKNLFNGKDLTGWTPGVAGVWSVDNGEIVGKSAEGLKKNEFITSNVSVGDFRLVLKAKLVPNGANSGIQFRSVRIPNSHEMRGCQADMGAGWWGKLYEESARGLLFPPKGKDFTADAFVKKDDWNTYEILAVGGRIRTAVNGNLCTELDDDKVAKEGIFGLQVHSGGPTEVRFKDFELELDPEFKLKTVK